MKKKEKSIEHNKKKTQRMELRHPRLQKADKGSESHA